MFVLKSGRRHQFFRCLIASRARSIGHDTHAISSLPTSTVPVRLVVLSSRMRLNGQYNLLKLKHTFVARVTRSAITDEDSLTVDTLDLLLSIGRSFGTRLL